MQSNAMSIRFAFVSLSVGLMLGGCGGPSDRPDLGYAEGRVTLGGEPLPKAMVTFQPDSGRPSFGITDEDGYYAVKYMPGEEGAKVGKHLVSISTYREPEEEGDPAVPEQVPVQYNRDAAENPEMTVEVRPGGNTLNWELSSEGEIYEPNYDEET